MGERRLPSAGMLEVRIKFIALTYLQDNSTVKLMNFVTGMIIIC